VSIILKIITSYQSEIISDIENTFEENDRKYRLALDFDRVTASAEKNN